MKTTNALVAAALAGVFAAGTATINAAQIIGSPTASETEKEKEKCDGKDKDKCPAKDKDKCPGKDGCPGKEKKEGIIL